MCVDELLLLIYLYWMCVIVVDWKSGLDLFLLLCDLFWEEGEWCSDLDCGCCDVYCLGCGSMF